MTPARPAPQSRCDGSIVTRVSMRLASLPPRRFRPPTRLRTAAVNRLVPLAFILSAGGAAMTALPNYLPHHDTYRPALTVVPAATDSVSAATAAHDTSPQPSRARATLVPLSDTALRLTDDTADEAEPWFLGANGTEAHRLRPADEPTAPNVSGRRRFAPDVSACGVFLTQVLASAQVTRCDLCRRLAAQAAAQHGSTIREVHDLR